MEIEFADCDLEVYSQIAIHFALVYLDQPQSKFRWKR